MNLLVTGGMGFIGSNFIRYYLDNHPDANIVNIDALRCGANPINLAQIEDDNRYSFVEGDIADYGLVSKLIKDKDVVVNFAAETHVDRSISAPETFFKSNVTGTFNLLEAIRKRNSNAKLVHISTDEVYGDILNGSSREDSPLKPSSPYSASKASSDLFVLAYARTYKMHNMITRCTNNYGPCQFPEKLIPKTIIRALRSLKIPIYGSGSQIRDWIHVGDHCRAVELVMERGEPGEIYNISAQEEKTNKDVVVSILKILSKDEHLIEFVKDRPGHDLRYSLDSTKIRVELGWHPKHVFADGLKETVNWYINNSHCWESLVDERVLHPTPWKVEW